MASNKNRWMIHSLPFSFMQETTKKYISFFLFFFHSFRSLQSLTCFWCPIKHPMHTRLTGLARTFLYILLWMSNVSFRCSYFHFTLFFFRFHGLYSVKFKCSRMNPTKSEKLLKKWGENKKWKIHLKFIIS